MKTCSICGVPKDCTEFQRDRSKKDGLRSACKSCVSRRKAVYNSEHREQNRRCCREWYEVHKTEISLSRHERNKRDPLPSRERVRRWRLANPHKEFNKTARRRMLTGRDEISKEQWLFCIASTNWSCFYCGLSLVKGNRTLDHVVPLSKGGSNSTTNLVPSCKPCNFSKQNRLPHQWLQCPKLGRHKVLLLWSKVLVGLFF